MLQDQGGFTIFNSLVSSLEHWLSHGRLKSERSVSSYGG